MLVLCEQLHDYFHRFPVFEVSNTEFHIYLWLSVIEGNEGQMFVCLQRFLHFIYVLVSQADTDLT